MKRTSNINVCKLFAAFAAALVLAALFSASICERALAAQATKLEVAKSSFKTSYKGALKDTVTVSPAYGRKVVIKYRNPATGKYEDVKSYKTANKKRCKLKVKIPKNWKTQETSYWKISVPKVPEKRDEEGNIVSEALSAKSVKVKVTCSFLNCKSAVLLDAKTGELVYSKNPEAKRRVASLTKMMTSALLVEKCGLGETVKVTSQASRTPFKYGFVTGQKMSVESALYAMMLPSANEIATASAIKVSGSVGKFVKLMNNKAAKIGCKNTTYKNPHGLDANGFYSTAYDQALIGRYIMTSTSCAPIRKAIRSKHATIKVSGDKFRLTSTNKLLGTKWDPIGIKTGTEDDAGYCFAGAVKVKGRTYISVVLGAKSESGRWSNTRSLISFAKYAAKYNLPEYGLG